MRHKKTYEEEQQEELDKAIKQNEIIYDSILSLCDLAHNIADSLHPETDDERILYRIRRVQDNLYDGEEHCRIEADRLRNAPLSAECFRCVINVEEATSLDVEPTYRIEIEDHRACLLHDLLQELTNTLDLAHGMLRSVSGHLRDGIHVLDMARRAYLYQKLITEQYFLGASLNNSVPNQ